MRADTPQAIPGRVGVFTTDVDLVVQSWDAWLEQHSGIPAVTAVGASLATLIPDLEARHLLPRLQEVLAQGVVVVLSPVFHHHLLRCPPAAPSPYFDTMQQYVTIAPLRIDERITGIIVTVEDVTAQRDRERDLATQLHSPHEAVRLRAAEMLATEEQHEPGPLTNMLGDTQWRVRRAAVAGLAKRAGTEIVADLLRAMREEHQDLGLLNGVLQVLAQTDVDVIGPLVEFLQDQNTDLRIYAALALADQSDPRPVAPLIAALDDSDPNVCFQAIETLGILRAEAAIEPLMTLAASNDFFLAFAAIEALRAIGDRRVAPRLVPFLADDMLREAAAEALGTLGDDGVVAPLLALLDTPDAPVTVIAQALVTLYERYETTYGDGRWIAHQVSSLLTPAGQSKILTALDRAAPNDRRSLALVLSWLDGPTVQRALARMLAERSVRPTMIEALVRFGAGATEVLVEQLAAEDAETRAAAVLALGRISDTRVVPDLLQVLETDPDLYVVAADALAKIGDHRAFDVLLQRIGDTDVAVRQAAISALNSLGHPQLEARVAKLLHDSHPVIRESAVRIAGYFGYPTCRDAILECVEDRDELVRQAAVEALPYFDDPRCLPLLLRVVRHDTPSVRAAAARALCQMDDPEAVSGLVGALDDQHTWVRYFAARSLGQHAYAHTVPALLRVLEADAAGQVRIAVVEALGRIGGEQVAQTLVPLTTAADSDLVRAALYALGQTRQPAALPPLLSALRACNLWQRTAAIEALALHGGDGVVPALQWVAAADTDPDIQQAAMMALGRIQTSEAAAALIELTLDPNLRASARSALADKGMSALGELKHGLTHPHPTVRATVVEILARLKTPAARDLIIAALNDDDPAVRVTAIAASGLMDHQPIAQKLADMARADPQPEVRRAAQGLLGH